MLYFRLGHSRTLFVDEYVILIPIISFIDFIIIKNIKKRRARAKEL